MIDSRPVLPYVTIEKNDATTYLYDPFTPTRNFALQDLRFTPPKDLMGGDFEMTIMGSTGANSEAVTLLSNISEGNKVTVYLGKTLATYSILFLGVIETIEVKEETNSMMQIILSGPDWGSNILKHRVISDSWIQKKTSDNITLDQNDDNVLVYNIAKNMIDDTSGSYPDKLYPVSISSMGVSFTPANVITPEIRLPQFEANFERVDDKLAELDEICNTVHYIDPSQNFIMRDKEYVTESGLLLIDDPTATTATTWSPQTKLGYIRPGSIYKKTIEGHRRRLFGLGGGKLAIDVSSTVVTHSTDMGTSWIAQRFTPRFTKCYNIGIYLGGSATVDLTLFLQEDLAGLPGGTTIRSLQVSKNVINSSGGWVYFPIDEDLTVGNNYWIVLSIDTASADTLSWYRDNVDANPSTSATSSDGTLWALTTNPNRYIYAHIVYTNDQIVVIHPISTTSTQKHLWEDVIHRPDITDDNTMRTYLQNLYTDVSRRKESLNCSIRCPDTIPQIGDRIRVIKSSSGYKIDQYGTDPQYYTLRGISYIFESGNDTNTGTYNFNVELVKMTSFT